MIKLNRLTGAAMFAGTALLLAACSNSESQQELQSGIILKNMDTTASPGNNFTEYVNGTWMKSTKVPSDKARYGVMDIINDKAQEDVKALIENAARNKSKEGSEEQKIGDYYESYMNMKVRDSIGLAPLTGEFKKIDALTATMDLAAYFAYANKRGDKIPFSLGCN